MTETVTGSALLGVDVSAAGRLWLGREIDERYVLAACQRFGISDILSRVLSARDVPLQEIEGYLNPRLRDLLPDPLTLKSADSAIARLIKAIKNKEKITVFGDYDVDGATSTSVLYRYFDSIGVKLDFYIPDRVTEGYGPNIPAFESIIKQGSTLVITVDCGTMSVAPLEYAKVNGLDVIVIDHHQTAETLPEACAVVNPRRQDDVSGLGHLAAVGVTFMVVVGLNRALRDENYFSTRDEPDLLQLLDLVALGTVCDVVPLKALNRAFVVQGLKVLASTQSAGLKALAHAARATPPFGTYELGYMLGPRVNAGGRVGEARIGAELLTTHDHEVAIGLALRLEDFNSARRLIESDVISEARRQIDEKIGQRNLTPAVLFASSDKWHPGVIGIAAGRLKDSYYRPSFVISFDAKGQGKGSARSISGFDLGQAVTKAQHKGLIIAGGGHAMAAGITLNRDQLPAFEQYMEAEFSEAAHFKVRQTSFDGVLSPQGANRRLFDELQLAGPYGAGNPEPSFVLPSVRITYSRIVGDGHVQCAIQDDGGGKLKGIAFNSTDEAVRALLMGHKSLIHLAGYLRADDWQGRRQTQFMIHDAAIARGA